MSKLSLGLSLVIAIWLSLSVAPTQASAQAATKRQQAIQECQAMYGGPGNFRKRMNTGMTVKQCVDQKMAADKK